MQIYVILIACVTGNLGAAYYFRNPEYTASCNPVFYMRRRFYELYRCDKKDYEFL